MNPLISDDRGHTNGLCANLCSSCTREEDATTDIIMQTKLLRTGGA